MRALHIPLLIALLASSAEAAEICGNGLDDDADGLADEGCYPGLTTDVCESPLSCNETGMVSPLLGGLRYALPPDVTPRVPYGLPIGFRRFYTSLYAPAAGAPAWQKPFGERWQHTYSTWISKNGSPPTGHLIWHTNHGQDARAAYASSSGGFDNYTLQAGYHVMFLRQRQAAPNEFQLKTLTGETFVYNSAGRLTEIWDTLTPTPNKVLLTYDASSNLSTVTDASNKRRLLFGYTSGVISSVQFQIFTASAWTTQHTTSYAYTTGRLTSVTIGGSLAQTNVYTSNYLTQIQDATGKSIVAFSYNATPGKVARIDAKSGMIGLDYNSARATCSGKTVLYFNLGTAAACSTDAGCGTGYLCGGKTGTGTTGRCFRAARCLTTATTNEDVVTQVTALGPPSESCTGTCTDVDQYIWDTTGTKLDLTAVEQKNAGVSTYTSRTFDANGMPTAIAYGDPDTNAANTNQARTEWRFYTDANFPGRVTEIRRKSDLDPSAASCSSTVTTGCARTQFAYSATTGKLSSITQTVSTLNSDNTPVTLTYTTAYSYDAKGRLSQIDGPLAGSNDVTQFTYHAPIDNFRDDFLFELKRKKDTSTFLTSSATVYDFWGNPTTLVDVDTTLTCLTFTTARGTLNTRREMMAGQTSCASPNSADLVTTWARDSALRLIQITRADGSCMFYEYDSKSRLQRTKRRDDCNAASAGDKQEFVYDQEGLVTEVQTYDSANVLTAKQPFSYFDSRRLEKVINPVDTSKWTGISYDARGLVSQIDGAGNIGKTVFNRTGAPGNDGRVTSVDKYRTSTAADTWNLIYSWLGAQTAVTDGDTKTTTTVRDDLGRVVRVTSPDKSLSFPTVNIFDEASRRIATKDQYGGATPRTHAFSFDNLGRPLDDDYSTNNTIYGSCGGSTNPAETQRVYDSVTCPGTTTCFHTQGRLAYVRRRLMCGGGTYAPDNSVDQETFYSYDDAGRVIREYTVDDTGRVQDQQYAWTKGGDLASFTTPSGAVIGWTYGSAGNNSDTDRVSAVWRTSTGTPIANNVLWEPYGPLKQYNHQNSVGGVALRTRLSHNLAYRTSATRVETQTGSSTLHSVVVTEDAKGRVTSRDYTPNTGGVEDSFFLYDDADRLLCETTSLVSSCPTVPGANIKNSHSASPPFTNAGDWKRLLRKMPGVTGTVEHIINPSGYGTSHRITRVDQATGTPTFGPTDYTYHSVFDGNRLDEFNATLGGNNYRWFNYDNENNLIEVGNFIYLPPNWVQFQELNAIDADHRRVFKTWRVVSTGETLGWFMAYDPLGRLTEVQYFPRVNDKNTYQLFQLIWIGERLVGYWQTDQPGGTTSKRYVGTDETGRPIDMLDWPSSGDATRVWSTNELAWGEMEKAGVFQPILFAGQYLDDETLALQSDGATTHRPGLVWNGYRTYDPFTGGYLQTDPDVQYTWSAYLYARGNPVGFMDPLGRDEMPVGHWVCESTSVKKNGVEHILIKCHFVSAGGPSWGDSPPWSPIWPYRWVDIFPEEDFFHPFGPEDEGRPVWNIDEARKDLEEMMTVLDNAADCGYNDSPLERAVQEHCYVGDIDDPGHEPCGPTTFGPFVPSGIEGCELCDKARQELWDKCGVQYRWMTPVKTWRKAVSSARQ